MTDFRKLTEAVYVSPQIDPADVSKAQAMGVKLIVNNRPDGEDPGQVAGAAIEAAARGAGMAYVSIPVSHAGFSMPQVQAMAHALAGADGPVLAYCRSGTRSTLLWALSQAMSGKDPQELSRIARDAGYDLSPVRAVMDALASQQ